MLDDWWGSAAGGEGWRGGGGARAVEGLSEEYSKGGIPAEMDRPTVPRCFSAADHAFTAGIGSP